MTNKDDHEMFKLAEDISYEDIFRQVDDENQDEDDTQQPQNYNNQFYNDDYPVPSNMTPDNDKYKRMKLSVMNKINISVKKRKWFKNLLAASLILCVVSAAISPYGRKTLADIVEKLYFIPGSGKAVVDNTEEVYILPKPISYECNGGSITIHTITMRSDSVTIYATGNIRMGFSDISIKVNGIEYQSDNASIGRGENNVAIYNFTIPEDNENFTIRIYDEFSIPVSLIKAEGFEDYEEMGPTCMKNNFGLTLVPYKLNHQIQFDVLQHHTNRGQVGLYGSSDKEGNDTTNILIHDNAGHTYTAGYPKSHFGTQSTFSFTPEKNASSYNIEIPELTLQYDLNNKIELSMPSEGETTVNKTVDMQGFKIDITKIIRKDDLITVFVNTNYNADNPENICYFLLDMDRMSLNYYHWILNDQITTEAFELYINPKAKKLTLYFKELYTILKGPWSFNISDKDFQ